MYLKLILPGLDTSIYKCMGHVETGCSVAGRLKQIDCWGFAWLTSHCTLFERHLKWSNTLRTCRSQCIEIVGFLGTNRSENSRMRRTALQATVLFLSGKGAREAIIRGACRTTVLSPSQVRVKAKSTSSSPTSSTKLRTSLQMDLLATKYPAAG